MNTVTSAGERVRPNAVYEIKATGKNRGGYVLRFTREGVEQLISQLQSTTNEDGVKVFLTTFENESKFNGGTRYLSATLGFEGGTAPEQKPPAKTSSSNRSAGMTKAMGGYGKR